MWRKFIYYFCGILLGIFMTIAFVYGQHGSWMDKYTGVGNMKCCGAKDCHAVPIALLGHDGIIIEALVSGVRVRVPEIAVHPSEDLQGWWCARDIGQPPSSENIRCLFYVIGT